MEIEYRIDDDEIFKALANQSIEALSYFVIGYEMGCLEMMIEYGKKGLSYHKAVLRFLENHGDITHETAKEKYKSLVDVLEKYTKEVRERYNK